jgi:hypothetical protein
LVTNSKQQRRADHGGVQSAAVLGVAMESWWPLSAWLTSGAAMFLCLNVLVCAVAVMSRGQGRRLCRSASSMVLGRLRSFSSMFSAAEWYDYRTAVEAEELHAAEAPPGPRSASAVTTAANTAPLIPASQMEEGEEKCTSLDEQNVPGQQHQAPSAAASAAEEATAVEEEVEGAGKEEPPAGESSTSKRRARTCRREAEEGMEVKAELNARAEQFIHQFKEDLKLQRLNSILNYTRALRRRAGEALSSQE